MTDEPATIQASFSDFRLIRSRKVCQLVMEVPIEGADAALAALGGIPQPHSDRWVAVARLNGQISPELRNATLDAIKNDPPKAAKTSLYAGTEPKEKRKWEDLKLSMQAGIRCEERGFQDYLGVTRGSAEQAAAEVRRICSVDSRSNLNDNPGAAEKWRDLDRSYQAWLKAAE